MQGYWVGNRVVSIATALAAILPAWLPGVGRAQSAESELIRNYTPNRVGSALFTEQHQSNEYSNWADLAEKVVQQPDKPYLLTLVLDKNTPADWQALRKLPSAKGISIQVADAVLSDSLLSILANWTTLEKIRISPVWGAQSFTMVKNAKGEMEFTSKRSPAKVPMRGWNKLRSVREVSLSEGLEMNQVLAAIQALPALESLEIWQFPFGESMPVTASFSGMKQLRKLRLNDVRLNHAAVFSGLPSLTDLVVNDVDVASLNTGLPFLTNLKRLDVTCFPVDDLRLGGLPALETLRLQAGRDRSRTRTTAVGSSVKLLATAISLDSVLAGLTTLKRVELEQVKLASFPDNLLKNRELLTLSMPDADLTTLPETIQQLTELTDLTLDNNPIRRLPDLFCRLKKLQRLSLSRCELSTLPAAIGDLTSLTSLVLNTNQLQSLPPSLGQLTNLRQLNVSMNQLTALPNELSTLPNLETIAAFWNKITCVPSRFVRLRDLYLSDNQLTELTFSPVDRSCLRSLVLDNNPIIKLPDSLGQLDSLETLVLGNNSLTALPNSIGSLRWLQRLVIGQNQLRVLPESIGGLTSLTSVTIADNPIAQLPSSVGAWRAVKTVSLTLPFLDKLPGQIGQWQALCQLTIDSDRLLLLPNELTDCQQITDLSITGNRLVGLPETIGKLTRLQTLTVSGRTDSQTGPGQGQLVALPASLTNCLHLTDLQIRDQQQFDGVEALQVMTAFPALRRLSLVNCGLTELSNVPWKRLPMLFLNLSKNRVSQLPAAFMEMPHLQQINLSETNLPQHLNRFFNTKDQLTAALKKTTD